MVSPVHHFRLPSRVLVREHGRLACLGAQTYKPSRNRLSIIQNTLLNLIQPEHPQTSNPKLGTTSLI